MAGIFDPEQIEELKKLPLQEAFERVKNALYKSRDAGSHDFMDAFEELVEAGVFTPEQLEEFLA